MRLLPLLLLPACAPSLDPGIEPDAGGPAAPVATTRHDDGTYTTVADCTSMETWRLVDLDTGVEAQAGEPWDLGCQRFHLQLDGGISGDAGVEVAPIEGVPFASVTEAPATGWITDAEDGDDMNTEPDYAFEQGDGWYAYDATTHVLTPRAVVWILRTTDDALIKLEIEDYYDAFGTAGTFTLHWAPLGAGA